MQKCSNPSKTTFGKYNSITMPCSFTGDRSACSAATLVINLAVLPSYRVRTRMLH